MRLMLLAASIAVSIASPAWSDSGNANRSLLLDRSVLVNDGETTIVRGRSPRSDGLSHQYLNMKTPLRGNFTISDVILPSDRWHTWDGHPIRRFDVTKQTPENYHDSHNHYQSLMSEVINATAGANGIPIWGDGAAVVNGASVWGGFFSARSGCASEGLISTYLPKDLDKGCGAEFDAQLTGVEVDVLNAGKPGVYPNKAKHGVQIVGFGNPNGQAVSVISENFDREPQFRRGQFESVLYAQNSLQPEYGRFIVMDFEKAQIGLDMRRPLFSRGAMDFHSSGVGTGILLESGKSGEIYGGQRGPAKADQSDWLTMRLGGGGFRLVSNDDKREFIVVDNDGRIFVNGELHLNGRPVTTEQLLVGDSAISKRLLALLALVAILALAGLNYFLVQYFVRRSLRSAIASQ